jgi:hypothetical protein
MEEQEQQQTGNQPTPAGLLYHYTDEKGLLGILKDDCIWATHYRFLNDLSERQIAIELISERIRQLASYGPSSNGHEVKKTYYRLIEQSLNRVYRLVDGFYVSFAEDGENDPDLPLDRQRWGDRLNQWRGYAQCRQGFSLGFDATLLKSHAMQLIQKREILVDLWKCEYGNEFNKAMTGNFSGFFNCFNLQDDSDEQDIRSLCLWKKDIHKWLTTFKHDGFKEEKEWRLVLQTSTDRPVSDLIKLNGKLHINVPIGLRGQNSPLKRIVVGPALDKQQAVDRLNAILKILNISCDDVVPSQIPYRN